MLKNFLIQAQRLLLPIIKNEQAAIKLANDIDADVNIYQLDNSNSKSVEDTFEQVVKDFGSINTLVNAAGFDIPQKFISEIDIEFWREVIDADINGFFNLVKFGLPYLRESHGSIVLLARLDYLNILREIFFLLHQRQLLSMS